jgi:hypothetical protein
MNNSVQSKSSHNIHKDSSVDDIIDYLKSYYSNDDDATFLSAYISLSEKQKEDFRVSRYFIQCKPEYFYYLPQKLKKDRLFNLEILKYNSRLFKRIDFKFSEDPKFMLEAVSANGLILTDIPKEKIHKDMVITAVKENAQAFQYAPDEFKCNLEIAKLAIKKKVDALIFIDDSLLKYTDELLLVQPIEFLTSSYTLKRVPKVNRLRQNVKDNNSKNLALKFEEVFSQESEWKEYAISLDKQYSLGLSLNKIKEESYYYFSIFMPYWKKKTIIKMKKQLNEFHNPAPPFETFKFIDNKSVFDFLTEMLDEELHVRESKENIQKVNRKQKEINPNLSKSRQLKF